MRDRPDTRLVFLRNKPIKVLRVRQPGCVHEFCQRLGLRSALRASLFQLVIPSLQDDFKIDFSFESKATGARSNVDHILMTSNLFDANFKYYLIFIYANV